MGDIADYYGVGYDPYDDWDDEEMDFKTWQLGNGSSVEVEHMTESHLRNCIAKIKREGWRSEWLSTLEKALKKKEDRWKIVAKTKMPFKRRTV